MKLKHWQGYGSINARKISETVNGNIATLKIELKGNHEYGLSRDDKYDVFNWLLNGGKRFVKACSSYRDIISVDITEDYVKENNEIIDTALYTITYKIS